MKPHQELPDSDDLMAIGQGYVPPFCLLGGVNQGDVKDAMEIELNAKGGQDES